MANTPNLNLEVLNVLGGNESAYNQILEIINKSNSNNVKLDNKFRYATQAEAEAGADDTKIITPLKVRQFFNANGGISGGTVNYVFQSGKRYWAYKATSVVNSVTIPANQFNPTTNIFDLVNDDNILLIKDVNYTLVGNLVTLAGFNLEIGETLHFLITNTSYSYEDLSNKPNIDGKISTHNTDSNAHVDIRQLINTQQFVFTDVKLMDAPITDYPMGMSIFSTTDAVYQSWESVTSTNGVIITYRLPYGLTEPYGETYSIQYCFSQSGNVLFRRNFNGWFNWEKFAQGWELDLKLPNSHNTDATSHDDIRQSISALDTNKANKTPPNWMSATLENGATGNIYFRKNNLGQIELQGSITLGTKTNSTIIATLPEGYSPARYTPIICYDSGSGDANIGNLLIFRNDRQIRIAKPGLESVTLGTILFSQVVIV